MMRYCRQADPSLVLPTCLYGRRGPAISYRPAERDQQSWDSGAGTSWVVRVVRARGPAP